MAHDGRRRRRVWPAIAAARRPHSFRNDLVGEDGQSGAPASRADPHEPACAGKVTPSSRRGSGAARTRRVVGRGAGRAGPRGAGMVDRAVAEVVQAMPQVAIECTGSFGDVAGDEGLLRQALLNLARNAAEACAEAEGGGRVVLRGEVVESDETGWQRLVITDNGPGITTEAMPKLFRPFFTTKSNGTGLGLAIVARRVSEAGGTLALESPVAHGRGTRFSVWLPLREDK